MKGKILFVAGVGVGYVLGARAGRKRYEQIKSAASNFWQQPAIQKQVDTAQDFAKQKLSDVAPAVVEGIKTVATNVINSQRERTAAKSALKGSGPKDTGPKDAASKDAASKDAASRGAAPKPSASSAATPPAASEAAKSAAAKSDTAAKSETAPAAVTKPATSKPSASEPSAD